MKKQTNLAGATDSAQLRRFGIVLGIMIPVFLGLLLPLLRGGQISAIPIWIGVVILIVAFVSPASLRHPYELWFKMGSMLGEINSRIILVVLYVGIFIPTGFIIRLLKIDLLGLRWIRDAATYRSAPKRDEIKSMEYPY